MTTKYIAANGTVCTDDDIEKWAEDAGNGFLGASFGAPVPGCPVSVGTDTKPFTLRLDARRRAKRDKAAQERHTTASEDVRAGRRETVPLEEIELELGLQDEPVGMSILDEIE